jgi:hypothetical protein
MLQGIVEKGELDCVGLDKYQCYIRVSSHQILLVNRLSLVNVGVGIEIRACG